MKITYTPEQGETLFTAVVTACDIARALYKANMESNVSLIYNNIAYSIDATDHTGEAVRRVQTLITRHYKTHHN